MKILTVSEVARSFSSVLDELERKQEEVLLVRNQHKVARLVPEPQAQDALEVFGDLYGTLDAGTADELSKAISNSRKGKSKTLAALKNPWAS